jgi:adenylate cyclase
MIRRLAAILAADVVAYSRLMEEDEAGTLAALRARRQEVLSPLVAQHGGRVFKLVGDGALVEFTSVVNAVECAVAVQKAIGERNMGLAPARQIRLRIGIHLGDVIVEGSDLYGDGVNLAARVEMLADPGGICVSADVYRQVRSKLPFGFQDLGEHKLKNIAEPMRAFRLLFEGEETSADATAAAPAPSPPAQKPSMAVLPFANISGDAEQDYFSEGIAEDIITSLSRNRAFFVISRSTTFTYKGPAVDIAKVARELGVRYVLEGSVRRAVNRVRITAQQIYAATGHHIWADRYDRELADVFAVQDEITSNIIGSIAPGILSAEVQRARRKDPSQLDAWDRVMRAHWHIRRFTQEDLTEARRLLAEAIALDPSNAMALSDLAFASHFEAVFGWGDGPAASFARCRDAARKAVAIDDGDAMAHTALAIHDLFSSRHDEARRRLHRALDLDPNSVFARGYLGGSYAFGGDYETALLHLDEAIRLSPRDQLLILWHLCKGWAALTAERYEEAIDFTTQAAEANPEFPDIYAVLAAAHGQLGRAAAAAAAPDQLLRRMPGLTARDHRLERPFARAVDRERFLEGLRKAGMPA